MPKSCLPINPRLLGFLRELFTQEMMTNGNPKNHFIIAGATDVDTLGKLKAACSVVQPSRQLVPRSSFRGSQGKSGLSWDSPPRHDLVQEESASGPAEGCLHPDQRA